MYDAAEANLKKQYQIDRSNLSAQSAISKNNTATALMQKGLSKSGESVQSSIMSDMAYMGALTQLANNNAQKLNELSAARQSAIAGVQTDMLNAQNEADRQEAQLEYQKERDKSSDDQWEKEFTYNASRDSVADYKWNYQQEYQAQKDEKDFEYTRERDAENDRRWNTEYLYQKQRDTIEDDRAEREIARDIYENDRDYKFELEKHEDEMAQTAIENSMKNTQNYHENYIKSQYLELEKEKLAQQTQGKTQDGDLDFGYSINAKGYIVPDVSPDEFLDIMLKGNGVGSFRGIQFVSPNEFEQRVRAMLKENRLDPDYLNLMEIYARGRGIIRDDLE